MIAAEKEEAVATLNHPQQRALERYGITLDAKALRGIEDRLAAGEGMMLRRNVDGAEVTVIRVADQLVQAVFMPATGKILTFNPLHREKGKRARA